MWRNWYGCWLGLGVLATLLCLSASEAWAKRPLAFTLEVTPSAGDEGEQFTATVHLELSGVAGPERYVRPDFWDFHVIDSTTRQTTDSVIEDGRQRLRYVEVHSYLLRPKTTGRLRIGPAKVVVGSGEFETRPAWLRVGPTSAALGGADTPPVAAADQAAADPTAAGERAPGFVPPATQHGEDVFLHVVTTTSSPVVGEQVTVTWLLYARAEVLQVAFRPLDDLDADVHRLFAPASHLEYFDVQIGRVPYRTAVVAKVAVFPRTAGPLFVPPLVAEVVTPGVPMDRPRLIESPSLPLSVAPLPATSRADFDPAYVGEVSLRARLDRTELRADEALTLHLRVTMKGAIQRTTIPELFIEGFRVRAPADYREELEVVDGQVRGQRDYEYWMTPLSEKVTEVPAIELPFFDPGLGRYRVAASDPLAVSIHPLPVAQRAVPEPGLLAAAPLRAGDTIATQARRRLDRRAWYRWAIAMPPLMLVVFAVGLTWQRRRHRNSPALRRQRHQRARAAALRRARLHLEEADGSSFYGALSRAVLDYVEASTDLSLGAATRSVMRDQLETKFRGPELVGQLLSFLDHCDRCRFAQAPRTRAEKIGDHEWAERLLDALEAGELAPLGPHRQGGAP